MARLTCMVFVGFVAVALMQCAAAQTVHVVGDGLGWTIPQGGGDGAYTSWAASRQFLVGDILMFNFTTNRHDVLQVPKESYEACTSTNPIGTLITTGPANVTLDSTGDHYYICTFSEHCQLGQRLSITVDSASSPRSTPRPSPPTTPSPTSGTPADCTPAPTSGPTAQGPTSSTNRPPAGPNSSSSMVLATATVSMLSIVMSLVF